MEMSDANEHALCTNSRPGAGKLRVISMPSTHLGLSGRHRSSSFNNERLWRPTSGFASKHQAELRAKRLHREQKMNYAEQIQQIEEDKTMRREAKLAKGPKPNDYMVVEGGEWKRVVSHGERVRTDHQTTEDDNPINFHSLLSEPPDCGFRRPLDSIPRSVAISAGRSLSQDEMEAADLLRRRKRQQMKRRQKAPLRRFESKVDTLDNFPHPSLLGKAMFSRRSILHRLADSLHVDDKLQTAKYLNTDVQRCRHKDGVQCPHQNLRKTKSASSMVTHQGITTMHKNDDSSSRDYKNQVNNRITRRFSIKLDLPQSRRPGSDSHANSPRSRKCGDKRDFFFRNLNYEIRNQLQVDEVAEFSVTDFEIATKISQTVLNFFSPTKDNTMPKGASECEENKTKMKPEKYPLVVTDGTACVGGNVLSFSDFFAHVNAIEINPTRVRMLRHNLQVLKKTNVECIHADYLDVMLELKQDVVFLDPPWGGPEYKDLDKVDLFLGGLPLHEICIQLQARTKCILLKVPSNFNDAKFSRHVPGKMTIMRDLKKMHLVLLDFR